MNFLLAVSILLPVALANSEGEKWTWPTSGRDLTPAADTRKDIYFDGVSNEKEGRIRVPTSYLDNNRRPLQSYQVREPTTNRPKPLSDEFSNEFTSSGENYGNNINGHNGIRNPSVNTPNRFGPQQQANDFPGQFGFGQRYPGAGGFQGGAAQFPGAFGGQAFPGQFGGGQGQFGGGQGQFGGGQGQFGGGQGGHYPGGIGGGFPLKNNFGGNGVLVGPGGPTGIIGRPYRGYPGQGQAYPGQFGGFQGSHGAGAYLGGYPGAGGFGFGPQAGYSGFEGQHNGIGGQFGRPFGQQGPQGGFGGGFPGPLFDPAVTKNAQLNKVEKSAR